MGIHRDRAAGVNDEPKLVALLVERYGADQPSADLIRQRHRVTLADAVYCRQRALNAANNRGLALFAPPPPDTSLKEWMR